MGKVSVQGSKELINYHPAEETDQIIELESRRSWMTDVYTCFFSIVMFRGKQKKI